MMSAPFSHKPLVRLCKEMKPEDLKLSKNLTDYSPFELYEAIETVALNNGDEVAARQSKPAAEMTYARLINDADFLSRSIPFEEHPIEFDMSPAIGVVVAVVAALKKNCRPVSNDRESKVKLIINDKITHITGTPPKHNIFTQYVVKGMEKVYSSRPELDFYNRKQLRRQDFLDAMIRTLVEGGKIMIKDKDRKNKS